MFIWILRAIFWDVDDKITIDETAINFYDIEDKSIVDKVVIYVPDFETEAD